MPTELSFRQRDKASEDTYVVMSFHKMVLIHNVNFYTVNLNGKKVKFGEKKPFILLTDTHLT